MTFFSAPPSPPPPTNVQLSRPSRMCWHTLERMDPAARTIQVGWGVGGDYAWPGSHTRVQCTRFLAAQVIQTGSGTGGGREEGGKGAALWTDGEAVWGNFEHDGGQL